MTVTGFGFDSMDAASDAARGVGLAQQSMAADLVVREDGRARGVRCVILQNDMISLEVVVDRGMDIGRARIEQIPMAWTSPTGLVAPGLLEQRQNEFLRGFHGGLLTTCGLDHIGPYADRSSSRFGYEHSTTEHLPMHGRVSAIPATLTGYGVVETKDGLEAFVTGVVEQVAVFGEHLRLSRRISIRHRSSEVRVEDEVTNLGYAPSPLAVMYHVNVGWPTFAPGARVDIGGVLVAGAEPRDILPPTPGVQQAVSIYAVTPDREGYGRAGIINPNLDKAHAGGVRLRWLASSLPTLVRWQLSNVANHYVLGLEPSTKLPVATPDGQSFPTLHPGETRTLGVDITLVKVPLSSLQTAHELLGSLQQDFDLRR